MCSEKLQTPKFIKNCSLSDGVVDDLAIEMATMFPILIRRMTISVNLANKLLRKMNTSTARLLTYFQIESSISIATLGSHKYLN